MKLQFPKKEGTIIYMSKILIAAMSLDLGGAETHIVELTRGLLARGHDVTVVSAGGAYVAELSAAGAKHYWAPLDKRKPRDMAKALGVLSFLIRTERFDVVHAHARIPAFLCGIMRRFHKFRFVTTAHWQFDARGLDKMLSNWGEHTLAVSEDIKQYLISTYNLPEEKITVTVNGIDTNKFSPAVSGETVRRELKLPVAAPVLVFVGRMDHTESAPTATIAALLDGAPELATRVKGLRIVLVGGGTREQEFMEKAAAVNSVVGREVIIMTGVRTDIPDVLAAADLFVGVSRSALEAMSLGLPVILAGSEGYLGLFEEDILDRAVNTNFCCRGEAKTETERLTADIAEFFKDFGKPLHEGTAARLGAYCRETVLKYYSVGRMTDDCELVYNATAANKAKSVVMSGYFGYDNAGDDAIMQTVYGNIKRAAETAEITVLSKNPELTNGRYGYSSVGRFNPLQVRKAIKQSDALVFGGGSLLQDHTSTRSLMYYTTIIKMAKRFNKPVMIYANGIGPVVRPKNRERVRRAVESVKIVTLRDNGSLDELRSMGVTREDIVVTGDPVYAMTVPSEAECREIIDSAGIAATRPYAVFAVRSGYGGEAVSTQLASLADRIYTELGFDIVFLAIQPVVDIAVSREVAAKMQSPAIIPERSFTARELVGLLKNARFAVSMRLHMLIFAERAGTPPCGIVVDPKIEANLKAFGLPGIGTPSELEAEHAFEIMNTMLINRARLSEALTRLSDEQRDRTETDIEKLRELLNNK